MEVNWGGCSWKLCQPPYHSGCILRNYKLPGGSVVKNLPVNAGEARDAGLIPGLGRSPGVGNGNLLQYSFLENRIDRRSWWARVPGVSKSQTFKHTNLSCNSSLYKHREMALKSIYCFTNTQISPIYLRRYTNLVKHLDLPEKTPSWWKLLPFFCLFSDRSILPVLLWKLSNLFRRGWWGEGPVLKARPRKNLKILFHKY